MTHHVRPGLPTRHYGSTLCASSTMGSVPCTDLDGAVAFVVTAVGAACGVLRAFRWWVESHAPCVRVLVARYTRCRPVRIGCFCGRTDQELHLVARANDTALAGHSGLATADAPLSADVLGILAGLSEGVVREERRFPPTHPDIHTSTRPHVHKSTNPQSHTSRYPHVHRSHFPRYAHPLSTQPHVQISTCPQTYISTNLQLVIVRIGSTLQGDTPPTRRSALRFIRSSGGGVSRSYRLALDAPSKLS